MFRVIGTYGRQDHRVLLCLLISAFAVAGLMALGGDRALAKQVKCGDTITTDTTLHNDLVDCPSNGIVIGADDITLDLNGHKVIGDGEPFTPCPGEEFCDIGLLNDGHDGVTVRDGSVRGFGAGPYVSMARHNRVLGISSSRNQFGIVILNSARILVRNSSGRRSAEDGLILFRSHHNRILHSSFRKNRNLGIVVNESANNLIRRNRLSRNDLAAIRWKKRPQSTQAQPVRSNR